MNVKVETDIDIDPQVETVAEHQPQHGTSHAESTNLHQDVNSQDIRGRGLDLTAVIISKMWLVLSFQVIYRDYRPLSYRVCFHSGLALHRTFPRAA